MAHGNVKRCRSKQDVLLSQGVLHLHLYRNSSAEFPEQLIMYDANTMTTLLIKPSVHQNDQIDMPIFYLTLLIFQNRHVK